MNSFGTFPDGKFIAVWDSYLQDGSVHGVYAQIFNNDGSKIGDEFYVPSNAYEAQTNPSVQVLNNGKALITYSSKHVAGSFEIYGQIVDQAGVKIGSEFQINTDTNDHQVAPIISKLTNGNIVVVYESGITDGSRNVKAQILDQSGSKLGSELLLITTSTDQR